MSALDYNQCPHLETLIYSNYMEKIELKKHSSLIAMSNRNISVSQRKLYNSVLYLSAKQIQEDPSKTEFKIKFSDIVKFSGYNDFSNRMYLKDSIRELVDTSIEFNILDKDKKNTWGIFSLLSQATIKDYDEYITVEFPSLILKNIEVPNIYALLNLSVVNSLSGKYSLPLYELLADYKKVRSFTITILKLREIVGVAEDEYKVFNWFKKRVLEPSVNEINDKTDLNVIYDLDKIDSRSYTHIIFTIKDKYADVNPIESSAYHLLKSKGLADTTAKRFAKELSKQSIVEAIEALERAVKKGSVKNMAAYLTKILKNTENIEHDEVVAVPLQQDLFSNLNPEKSIPDDTVLFKKYTKKRVFEIIQTLSTDDYKHFIQNQTEFGIEHLLDKGFIDEHKNIINMHGMTQYSIFLGWVENKYFDREIEYKLFREEFNN